MNLKVGDHVRILTQTENGGKWYGKIFQVMEINPRLPYPVYTHIPDSEGGKKVDNFLVWQFDEVELVRDKDNNENGNKNKDINIEEIDELLDRVMKFHTPCGDLLIYSMYDSDDKDNYDVDYNNIINIVFGDIADIEIDIRQVKDLAKYFTDIANYYETYKRHPSLPPTKEEFIDRIKQLSEEELIEMWRKYKEKHCQIEKVLLIL